MADRFRFAAAILLLGVLHQSIGADIDCENLTTANCKKLFGETLDKEYKTLHLETAAKLTKRFLKINDELVKELPAGEFTEFINKVKETSAKVNADLAQIEENTENYTKLIEIVKRLLDHLKPNYNNDSALPKEVKEIVDRNDWEVYIVAAAFEMMNKISQAYINLYVDLREQDLKDFPIYTEIKELMKTINRVNKFENFSDKAKAFDSAAEKISENFESPYIKGIQLDS